MERFVILLALAGLSYLLLYTEGLVKTSRARFAVLGVLLAAFGVRLEGGEDLRRAFVLSEIISKPLALRPRDERLSAW